MKKLVIALLCAFTLTTGSITPASSETKSLRHKGTAFFRALKHAPACVAFRKSCTAQDRKILIGTGLTLLAAIGTTLLIKRKRDQRRAEREKESYRKQPEAVIPEQIFEGEDPWRSLRPTPSLTPEKKVEKIWELVKPKD